DAAGLEDAMRSVAPAAATVDRGSPLVTKGPSEAVTLGKQVEAKAGLKTRPRRPQVVIVGAGFGGLSAAKALGSKAADVTLIDRNNYHTCLPLLYQVATAGLEAESIVYPVRAILRRHHNVDFRLSEVVSVDFQGRRVLTHSGPVPYDYLILAAGSAGNYFGNDALAEHTYGLKDIADAEQLRNRVLSNFEAAAREPDAERRRALLTFVIVGGGPTGVE